MLLLWLGIVWTAAAFGEEIFFRGFLITRTMALFGGRAFAVKTRRGEVQARLDLAPSVIQLHPGVADA